MNNLEYLGKIVNVKMDRKLGSVHPKHGFVYPVNYGYIPDFKNNTLSPKFCVKIRFKMC